jgi:hypothetical protein
MTGIVLLLELLSPAALDNASNEHASLSPLLSQKHLQKKRSQSTTRDL